VFVYMQHINTNIALSCKKVYSASIIKFWHFSVSLH